jgi:hypothetical protein
MISTAMEIRKYLMGSLLLMDNSSLGWEREEHVLVVMSILAETA